MELTPRLLEAQATADWSVWVRFEDGVSGEIDFEDLRDGGPVFRPLRDPDFFRQVKVDDRAVTFEWPGEVDIAPETLYLRAQEASGVAS
jgi:hypothetical protein